MAEIKNIIVAGAGFGGITAAIKLAKKTKSLSGYKVILIDCHNYQLYTPALYEIASIPKEYAPAAVLKSSIALPIQEIVQNRPIEFLQDNIENIDIPGKKILLKDRGILPFAYLVLALGSETNYFAIPGLKEHSFPLKTFHDAVRLRNALEDLVKNKDSIKIAVGGAGSAGVELVAEFVNFVCTLKEQVVHSKKCDVQFTLIEASEEILSGFDRWLVDKAKKRLKDLGVTIKTRHVVTKVNSKEIIFQNGEKELFDILIWTGGVRGPSLFQKTNFASGERGAVKVDEFLRITGFDGTTFAVGDNASFIDTRTQKPLIWNVPAAEQQGRFAARNIINSIEGRPLEKFVPMKKYPYILAVGKKYAIADLIFVRFSGFFGWITKQLVEFRYLLSVLPLRRAYSVSLRGFGVFSSND